jgi:hypothetical protein
MKDLQELNNFHKSRPLSHEKMPAFKAGIFSTPCPLLKNLIKQDVKENYFTVGGSPGQI